MNIKIGIAVVSVSIIVGGVCWFLFGTTSSQPVAETINGTALANDETLVTPPEQINRSSTELVAAITAQIPSLVSTSGQPLFSIQNTQRIDNVWYVTTIASTSLSSSAKIILKDGGDLDGGLVVVAGPGTYFPDSTPVPDTVKRVL